MSGNKEDAGKRMSDEQISFLKQFNVRTDPTIASHHALGQPRHFMVPTYVCEALANGLLTVWVPDGFVGDVPAVVNSPKIYSIDFVLTELGRKTLGIEPEKTTERQDKKTSAKELQPSLF